MKRIFLVPRLLLFLFFIPLMVFLAIVPLVRLRLWAFWQLKGEYVQTWSNMWRWTIGEDVPEDERPSTVLLVALSAFAVVAVITAVRMMS